MQKNKYIHDGKCIWCGRGEPTVTFYTKPHMLPKALGGYETCLDVCDECNLAAQGIKMDDHRLSYHIRMAELI